ncbi:FAD-dependent oxidoreductase [Cupriavidus numazuensis]|uniref:Fructose dehydrogenase large subunit n=1 Tax=Cupriavidus numazuensis TaxID=221992 RepID=A0ABM8TTC8_9BURK|nr:GMC family oxidoreductase [Cupriavidus numazuensis]CAG2159695.1 Fructose dehydrogenase large subunit [Cupriavidus numazuensis]
MFIDTRKVEQDSIVRTTVCIIGAGVAGITLALELQRAGIATCLLESGGFKPDDETRDLYRGENVGLPYTFADGSRSRYLGGSSNCWGGWCRPLDPWDLERRDWVPNSGWPFGLDTLTPYYQRTHDVLKLGPDNFDPAWWEAAIGRADVRRLPLTGGKIRDTISQFSPPARFGKLYREALSQAHRVRVYLYANVVSIDTNPDATAVTQVSVRTLNGRSMKVAAQVFVLAAGGIENARLLLASSHTQSVGLGNGNDLVGRYFMDHPRLMSGDVRFRPQWARNKLYDIKYHYQNAAVSAHGQHISSQFALRPEVLQREGLLNSRVWFYSMFYGEGSAGAEALIRAKQALLKKDQPGYRPASDLLTMLRHPVDTVGFGLTRLLQPRSLISGVRMQAIVEAEPDPESRVTLSDQRDALGIPRVRVSWKLGSLVQRTFDRTFALLAEELAQSGVADVTLDPPVEGSAWPAQLEGTWHHMGTTRMHVSPRQGVVDPDCRVHGIGNLYIGGSSVFPTVGANFPTITIAALALRLADHLAARLATAGDGAGRTAAPVRAAEPQEAQVLAFSIPAAAAARSPA